MYICIYRTWNYWSHKSKYNITHNETEQFISML